MFAHRETLDLLSEARSIADYARLHGVAISGPARIASPTHLGGVLADVVLQAGLNYQTVVRARVEHIVMRYPAASILPGVQDIIAASKTEEFLQWKHPVKLDRFIHLVSFLGEKGVSTVSDARSYLAGRNSRADLLAINGIGPKTFDYFCNLIGLDRIAVDRHVFTFVAEAGVGTTGYEHTQKVASFAADLLGMRRRDFDSWMWRHVSERRAPAKQLRLDSLWLN